MDDQPRRGESCAIVSVILGIILSWVGVLSAVALLVLSSE